MSEKKPIAHLTQGAPMGVVPPDGENEPGIDTRRRYLASDAFGVLCFLAMTTCLLALVGLLAMVIINGLPWVSWKLLSSFPSRTPENAGILSALVGSVWLISLTVLISVPIGIGSALYLEEYSKPSRWRRLVQLNIANLAGVPSIVYGILGLGLFVRAMSLQRSVLAGALTLTLVVLPIVILSAQEALRAVPKSIRLGSYALGATRWQTTWHQVLPAALPGMMTGVILAMARALGEAAPLLAVGAVAYIAYVPRTLSDEFTALPLQIYNWASRPQAEFHGLASAAIIVLLAVLILLNAGAVFVRSRYGKRVKW
ncbi:Phosphate transport system permease protein PstA [Pseudobythopirellula maris]|uniref:Phosphate transport system permease protein PstA n=1 Tax=Pseudobythopirellula maris TaxID=2527991 RepID=A0A5C5ZS19_9BACT|nr:phosphate ABC transporter permease PstA [Pseudobythopirellula maris]TWT89885.1 Phosphate transport system permease protein PstA [Pseudobythopirellula maris]